MAGRFKHWLYDGGKKQTSLRVATTALECDHDPRVNREKMERVVQAIKTAHPSVELILFGEAITSWYRPYCDEYHRAVAEPVPGETTRAMAALARKHQLYLSFGLSESSDGSLFSSQVLINPAGEIQAVHRKMGSAPDLFEPGPTPVTFTEVNGLRTGIVICSDIASASTMWKLATQELDLILLSLADDCRAGLFAARFNARMHHAWVVTANRSGEQEGIVWDGHMAISDPRGVLRVAAQGAEQHIVYDITLPRAVASTPKTFLRNVVAKTAVIRHLLNSRDPARALP
jgi:predicted amidohydrolase